MLSFTSSRCYHDRPAPGATSRSRKDASRINLAAFASPPLFMRLFSTYPPVRLSMTIYPYIPGFLAVSV